MHAPDAAPEPITADHLPDDVATLQRMIVELLATLQQRERDNEALRHRLDLLLKRLYGPRGERYDPNQPWLFADLAAAPDSPAAPAEPGQPASPMDPSAGRGRMAAAACRPTCPARSGTTTCPRPSACARAAASAASTSASTAANNWITGRRRCS